MSNTYPVFTIADIARIPDEALPRFLAELPELIEIARPLVMLNDAARANGIKITPEQEREMFARLDWVDDDKGTVDVKIHVEDGLGEVASGSFHYNMKKGQPA